MNLNSLPKTLLTTEQQLIAQNYCLPAPKPLKQQSDRIGLFKSSFPP
ncbi:hypothetical protein [Rivularia sp. UHCC 0363]|nr:hypothetical protein [Rivularia sp. UHCC 0363]MEA5593953.1 hypothetical protein [Rivularia sp. UHCC 0363]